MKKVFTHLLIPRKSVRFLPQLGGMCLFLVTSFLVHAAPQAVSLKDECGLSYFRDLAAAANGKSLLALLYKSDLNQKFIL